jgi:tRNA A-37 threonylcarbamoyl transferase component Bud32
MDRAIPSLAPGTILGGWSIVRPIAQGGMGAVYEAANTVSGARRALKIVRPDLTSDADARARFVREVTLASRIRHPNVVESFDPLVIDGLVVLPMELLEGETLAARLRRGTLTPIETIDLVITVARAVAAFHAHRVIHRDLKPANLFLAEDELGRVEVKVLDFGAARETDGDPYTLTGHSIGSPAYMAPEQAQNIRDLDERVDVYALGVILYVAVTGRRPYESDDHGSAIAKLIMRAWFPPPSTLAPGLPPQLEAVILRAMSWDRAARYPSALELADALVACRSDLAAHARPSDPDAATRIEPTAPSPIDPSTAIPVPARRAGGGSRRWGALAFVAAAMLVFASWAAYRATAADQIESTPLEASAPHVTPSITTTAGATVAVASEPPRATAAPSATAPEAAIPVGREVPADPAAAAGARSPVDEGVGTARAIERSSLRPAARDRRPRDRAAARAPTERASIERTPLARESTTVERAASERTTEGQESSEPRRGSGLWLDPPACGGSTGVPCP